MRENKGDGRREHEREGEREERRELTRTFYLCTDNSLSGTKSSPPGSPQGSMTNVSMATRFIPMLGLQVRYLIPETPT